MTDSFEQSDVNFSQIEDLLSAIKEGRDFAFEIDGETVEVPASAEIEIEYERESGEHALEIKIFWDAVDDVEEDDAEDEDESSDDDDSYADNAGEDLDEEEPA